MKNIFKRFSYLGKWSMFRALKSLFVTKLISTMMEYLKRNIKCLCLQNFKFSANLFSYSLVSKKTMQVISFENRYIIMPHAVHKIRHKLHHTTCFFKNKCQITSVQFNSGSILFQCTNEFSFILLNNNTVEEFTRVNNNGKMSYCRIIA